MYLNDKRFTIRTKEKKDGVDWIVDLKFTKKWKEKWEKKDGFCRVVDLNLQRNKRIWKVPKKKTKKRIFFKQRVLANHKRFKVYHRSGTKNDFLQLYFQNHSSCSRSQDILISLVSIGVNHPVLESVLIKVRNGSVNHKVKQFLNGRIRWKERNYDFTRF